MTTYVHVAESQSVLYHLFQALALTNLTGRTTDTYSVVDGRNVQGNRG